MKLGILSTWSYCLIVNKRGRELYVDTHRSGRRLLSNSVETERPIEACLLELEMATGEQDQKDKIAKDEKKIWSMMEFLNGRMILQLKSIFKATTLLSSSAQAS